MFGQRVSQSRAPGEAMRRDSFPGHLLRRQNHETPNPLFQRPINKTNRGDFAPVVVLHPPKAHWLFYGCLSHIKTLQKHRRGLTALAFTYVALSSSNAHPRLLLVLKTQSNYGASCVHVAYFVMITVTCIGLSYPSSGRLASVNAGCAARCGSAHERAPRPRKDAEGQSRQ